MNERTMRTLGVLAAAGAAAVALAGCGASPDAGQAEDGTAARFTACLTAGGVDARIDDGTGLVFVRSDAGTIVVEGDGLSGTTITAEALEGDEFPLMQMGDADGTSWIAVSGSGYFAEADPGIHEVYAACEAEHSDFAQVEFDPMDDPMLQEQIARQTEAGIAFARCARDAGFAWVADPSEDTSGAIVLPLDLAEGEFRALLEACPEEAAGDLSWMIDGELGFDWFAVLDEVVGITGGSGMHIERDE